MNPFAIITSVENALGLARTIKDIVDDAKLKTKSIELYDAIISLQSGIFSMQAENHTLLQEKNALEAQLMKIKNWDKEKAKYELVEIGTGVHVFSFKEENPPTKPPHYICPKCYYEEKQSILVALYIRSNGNAYGCPECKNKFYTNTEGLL